VVAKFEAHRDPDGEKRKAERRLKKTLRKPKKVGKKKGREGYSP